MHILTDNDECLHLGYPRQSESKWKENYYFNFIDKAADAVGIIHFSIRRDIGRAIFNLQGRVGGERLRYSNNIAWPAIDRTAFKESVVLSDGCLTLEIVEPHKKHRVTFENDTTKLDLNYTRRFDVYQYPDHTPSESEAKTDVNLDIEHYEQGLHLNGNIEFNGKVFELTSLAHRDHSWGYRDESGIVGWNWTAIQFESATLNFTQTVSHKLGIMGNGFISTIEGNKAIVKVEVNEVINDAKGEPEIAKYTITDEDGAKTDFTARRFTSVVIPMNKEKTTMCFENFSEFTNESTGEIGLGIDEHMLNV